MSTKEPRYGDNDILAIFDGQGMHWDGMGKEVHQQFEAARQVFNTASDVVGVDMEAVCFGRLAYLQDDTRIAQPAIATVALAEYRAWQDETETEPSAVTGFSLGLWTALSPSGALGPNPAEADANAVYLIARRSEIIQKVASKNPGLMAAIIGLLPHHIPEVLRISGAEIAVKRSKFKHHTVVSGTKNAIDKARKIADEKGARRFLELSVPFAAHSSHQEDTTEPIIDLLSRADLIEPEIDLISNEGQLLEGPQAITHHLAEQMTSHVDWVATMDFLASQGIKRVVGFGPDKKKGLQNQLVSEYGAKAEAWRAQIVS